MLFSTALPNHTKKRHFHRARLKTRIVEFIIVNCRVALGAMYISGQHIIRTVNVTTTIQVTNVNLKNVF